MAFSRQRGHGGAMVGLVTRLPSAAAATRGQVALRGATMPPAEAAAGQGGKLELNRRL